MTDFRIEQTSSIKKIFLDGAEISDCVTRVEVDIDPYSRPTRITLHLNVTTMEISTLGEGETRVMVNIPQDVAETLMYLGWNPPEVRKGFYTIPLSEGVNNERH